jgi:2-keto-4-pentenoate hydratase/2-oxohepta-3-ene-1,7-dioic acid hydratase in catechol pathway
LICVGTNYKKHLLEIGLPFPKYPVLFSKFDNALVAHEEVVELPPNASNFDYEAELVLVIGRQGKGITAQDAFNYIFGITCGNDLSARELQFQSSQWLLGKTPDGFGPVGPHIRTLEGIDPDSLGISLRLNGEVRQQASTADMIFGCAELISFISQAITLMPGDVIFTGTPEGVIQGHPENERVWLKAGDVVEVEIEGLAPLRNTLK